MAAPKTPKYSTADLEREIAQLSTALDKARAKELAAAEKAVVAGKKALQSAKKKVADLMAKQNKTPAVKARLSQAKQDLAAQTKVNADAQAVLAELKSAQALKKEVAQELAKLSKTSAKKVKKTKPDTAKPPSAKKTAKTKAAPTEATAPPTPERNWELSTGTPSTIISGWLLPLMVLTPRIRKNEDPPAAPVDPVT